VVEVGANFARRFASNVASMRMEFALRNDFYAHLQSLQVSFHDGWQSGQLLSRAVADVESVRRFIGFGLVFAGYFVALWLCVLAILVWLDWKLALLMLLLGLPIYGASHRFFRHYRVIARRVQDQTGDLTAVIEEMATGVRIIKAFGRRREPRNQHIFEDVNGRYRDANIWATRLSSTYGPGISFLGRLTTLAVLALGGLLVTRGQLTLGVLTAFVLYVRQFFEPMQDLSQFYTLFQAAAAALEKLAGVLDESSTVPEPDGPVRLDRPLRGELELRTVTFGYLEAPVLHAIDVRIPAGQTLALVGETGAGKTTIARLLARFYDPSRGSVLLDGVDLRSLPDEELRSAVVMVTQEGFLFTGSIADNIAFGRPAAGRAEVERAARAVGADAFIRSLPEGYDTEVRRRGVRLSSGQRQLVAFARAFLADPRVLILDEATSSLDLPTERLVQHALQTLLADRTAIIIAHRLSTVEVADRVLVVDAGRIVEDGAPAALIGSGGRYDALHRSWLESLA
jgi:ATP-binding cassette subfamily B protein